MITAHLLILKQIARISCPSTETMNITLCKHLQAQKDSSEMNIKYYTHHAGDKKKYFFYCIRKVPLEASAVKFIRGLKHFSLKRVRKHFTLSGRL